MGPQREGSHVRDPWLDVVRSGDRCGGEAGDAWPRSWRHHRHDAARPCRCGRGRVRGPCHGLVSAWRAGGVLHGDARCDRAVVHLSPRVRPEQNHNLESAHSACYPLAVSSCSAPIARVAFCLALGVVLGGAVDAQWLNYPAKGTPRLPDRKPDLNAPAPRAADGTPDLSGIWEVVGDLVMPTDGRIRSKYVYNIAADLPDGAPFLPWAKALHDERTRTLGVGAPTETCLPHGIPDAM